MKVITETTTTASEHLTARDLAEITKYFIDEQQPIGEINSEWLYSNSSSLKIKNTMQYLLSYDSLYTDPLVYKEMRGNVNYQLLYFLSRDVSYEGYQEFIQWVTNYIQVKIDYSRKEFEKQTTVASTIPRWRLKDRKAANEQKILKVIDLKRYESFLKNFKDCISVNSNAERLAFISFAKTNEPHFHIPNGEKGFIDLPISIKKDE